MAVCVCVCVCVCVGLGQIMWLAALLIAQTRAERQMPASDSVCVNWQAAAGELWRNEKKWTHRDF